MTTELEHKAEVVDTWLIWDFGDAQVWKLYKSRLMRDQSTKPDVVTSFGNEMS